MVDKLRFTYAGDGPLRLDKVIEQEFKGHATFGKVSRSQLKGWIERGQVRINDLVVTKAGAIIKPHSVIEVCPDQVGAEHLVSFEFPLSILYEDGDLIVINKPAGLSVHPGAGNRDKTLVNALLFHFETSRQELPESFREMGDKGVPRPGIVHRLDQDTTGVLVVAKTIASHAALAEQFSKRTAQRVYQALVLSTPRGKRRLDSDDSGVISTAFGRHPTKRTAMAVLKQGGKPAITEWQIVERLGYANLVEVRLKTGRTHQIRVHLAHIGSPVIGDREYGEMSALPHELKLAQERFGRQALHAYKLEIAHPGSGEKMDFQAPTPADMTELVNVFRKYSQ